MNIEELNKRKGKLQTDLTTLRKRITADTQNAFRTEGAIMDINDIIAADEKKVKEAKEKEEKGKKGEKK